MKNKNDNLMKALILYYLLFVFDESEPLTVMIYTRKIIHHHN